MFSARANARYIKFSLYLNLNKLNRTFGIVSVSHWYLNWSWFYRN